MLTRRIFIAGSAVSAAGWLGGCRARGGGGPALISTWEDGRAANTEAWKTLASGGNALDAVERGVNLVEVILTTAASGLAAFPTRRARSPTTPWSSRDPGTPSAQSAA